MYVLYDTIGKIASSIRQSHITSWNAWLGLRTVTLRWTTSTCKYSIPVNHKTMQCTTKQQITALA